jgi:CxxC motif-containing protein
MAKDNKVICIGCPLGCWVTVEAGPGGKVNKIKGHKCKEGEKFIIEEFTNPVRIFTGTIPTGNADLPLLPVRTSVPIPKENMKKAAIAALDVKPKLPIKVGDVLIPRFMGTEADLIATSNLD